MMTEEESRRQFDRNRRAGKLTFVVDGAGDAGIALGLNGPSKIVLHEGNEASGETSRFSLIAP